MSSEFAAELDQIPTPVPTDRELELVIGRYPHNSSKSQTIPPTMPQICYPRYSSG